MPYREAVQCQIIARLSRITHAEHGRSNALTCAPKMIRQGALPLRRQQFDHGIASLEASRPAGDAVTRFVIGLLRAEKAFQKGAGGIHVAHGHSIADKSGQAERVFIAPVSGGFHRLPTEQIPVAIVEISVVKFEGDAKTVRRMSVQGKADITHDANAMVCDRGANIVDIRLIFDPDVMRAIACVQQEFVRHETFEDDPTDIDQISMQFALRHIGEQKCAEFFAQMRDAGFGVLEHYIHVVQPHRSDRFEQGGILPSAYYGGHVVIVDAACYWIARRSSRLQIIALADRGSGCTLSSGSGGLALDHRLFFVIGDLLANIAIGLIAGLLSWAIVDHGWNMWLAMIVMMALGMIAGLVLFFAVTIKLGAMEAMVPLMFSGMLSGMVVGMAGAMVPLTPAHAALLGMGSGLAGICIVWTASSLLRGVSRQA